MRKYIFRMEPVPYTGNNHGFRNYCNTYFRRTRTTNEKRQYYGCELSNIIRARRKPICLQFAWDDIDRCSQKSWKKQSKKHRQHGYNQHLIRNFKCYQLFGEDLY